MKLISIATAIAVICSAPAAMAKPGEGQGKGHHHAHAVEGPHTAQTTGKSKGWSTANGGVTHRAGRTHPHGMPPGQAKKWVAQNGGLRVGGVLPASYPGYQTLSPTRAQTLPIAPAGTEYVRVGDDVYLRQTNTGVIASVLQGLLR